MTLLSVPFRPPDLLLIEYVCHMIGTLQSNLLPNNIFDVKINHLIFSMPQRNDVLETPVNPLITK